MATFPILTCTYFLKFGFWTLRLPLLAEHAGGTELQDLANFYDARMICIRQLGGTLARMADQEDFLKITSLMKTIGQQQLWSRLFMKYLGVMTWNDGTMYSGEELEHGEVLISPFSCAYLDTSVGTAALKKANCDKKVGYICQLASPKNCHGERSCFLYEDKAYQFITSAKSSWEAQSDCFLRGGQLAILKDNKVLQFAAEKAKALHDKIRIFWVALRDVDMIDYDTGRRVTYFPSGSKLDPRKECTLITPHGLISERCDAKHKFICSDLQPSFPTTPSTASNSTTLQQCKQDLKIPVIVGIASALGLIILAVISKVIYDKFLKRKRRHGL